MNARFLQFKNYWKKRLPIYLGRKLAPEDLHAIDFNASLYSKSTKVKMTEYFATQKLIYMIRRKFIK